MKSLSTNIFYNKAYSLSFMSISGQVLSCKYCALKKNQVFLIYKEIQNGAVAKSCYMTNGLLIQYMGKYLRISSYIRKPFLIYDFATTPLWISLYVRKIFFFFFISVGLLCAVQIINFMLNVFTEHERDLNATYILLLHDWERRPCRLHDGYFFSPSEWGGEGASWATGPWA